MINSQKENLEMKLILIPNIPKIPSITRYTNFRDFSWWKITNASFSSTKEHIKCVQNKGYIFLR